MKTNNLSLMLVFLSILQLLGAGCDEPKIQEMEVPIPGKFIFVEDFTGRHGILAGNFGNLVLIDSETQTRYALTDDHYYYAYPNLVNEGKGVWFESKRGSDLYPAGLGSTSDIYSLDISTGKIRNIRDSLSAVFNLKIEEHATKWSVSPFGKKMVFVMRDYENPEPGSRTSYFYVDKTEKEALRVEYESGRMPWAQTYWALDETKISYELHGHKRVYAYDKEKNEKQIIMNDFIESVEKPFFCDAGSWKNNNSFVYSCDYSGGNQIKFFLYDYENDSSTQIAEIVKENFSVRSLHISRSDNYLVFIGNDLNSEDFSTEQSGIYVYDVDTGDMRSFALSNRDKRWLRWYEDL